MEYFKKLRCIDMTRILSGPYATMLLADLGMEVIKIEPLFGDETRKWGPPFVQCNGSTQSTYFLSINRNKKSIAIDLKQPQGKQIIYDLVLKSDVLVQNFSTEVMDNLDLSYAKLQALNPQLVYASLNGFGFEGPDKNKPGFDAVMQAFSGLMHITGDPAGPPTKLGVAITDVLTALHATVGIMAALMQRQVAERGQEVRTSLLECSLSSLANISSQFLNGGIDPHRLGNHHPSIVPYGTYEIQNNKYITVACGTDAQSYSLCECLNLANYKNDSRFATNSLRVINREKLNNILNTAFKQIDDIDQLVANLELMKIPCGKTNSISEVLSCAQAQALGIVKEAKQLHSKNKIFTIKNPLSFSSDKLTKYEAPPSLNQDQMYILKSILKYNDNLIQNLIKQKVILDQNF